MGDIYDRCGLTREEVDNWTRNRVRMWGFKLLDDVKDPDRAKIYMYAVNALKDGPKKDRILKILEESP